METESRFAFLELDNDIVAPAPAPVAPPKVTVVPVIDIPVVAPSKEGKLVAVAQADESTGAVVYWQLTGTVHTETLKNAWLAAGLREDLLPKQIGPTMAFSRALKEFECRNVLVRKHNKGGWGILATQEVEGKMAFVETARVWLGEDNTIKFDGAETGWALEDLERLFRDAMENLSHIDVSAWFVWLLGQFHAVALRDRGGIYFVPRQAMELFHQAKAVIETVSQHVLCEIPAMHSSEAVQAIFDAISREAADTLMDVANEIAGDIGPRAARNRMEDLNTLKTKVAGYEALLGRELGGVKDQIKALNAKLNEVSSRTSLLEV